MKHAENIERQINVYMAKFICKTVFIWSIKCIIKTHDTNVKVTPLILVDKEHMI